MRSPVTFIRARLSRAIFALLVLSTIVTFGVVIAGYWTYQAVGFTTHFQEQHHRAEAYFSWQFEQTWRDPEARNAEFDALKDHMGFSARLYDAEGNLLREAECVCDHRTHDFALRDASGAQFGRLELCDPGVGPKQPFIIMLILVLVALWFGSALVSQRIGYPLMTLRDTARRFGNGDLSARARLDEHDNEIGEVAKSFDQMADQIAQQFEENNALLAEVSHELRTPLGHLKMLVELIREGANPQKHLAGLEREVDAIDMLVEQLLAKSRLAFDMTTSKPLEVAALAIDAMERTNTPFELLEVGDDVDTVMGDANLLAAALTNLLRNAHDHGGGVTGVRIAREGDDIIFVVEDAGPGVDEAVRETLFQPFVKGNGGHDGGLGLGLALVRRIVEAHSGSMILVSDDAGAHVGFAIPAQLE